MSQKLSGFSITIIGLVLAALGIVSPIAWDWYSKKSELTLYRSELVSLVEQKESVDGLKITYKGHDVDSLGKTIFKLENTGRTPIEGADLISPPTIRIVGGKMLHASIENLKPNNIEAKIHVTDDQLSITFPLLNSGDSVYIGILSSGNDIQYLADSRIKNIYQLLVVEDKSEVRFRTSFGIGVYVVGFFTLIFVIVFFGLSSEVPKRSKVIRDIRNGNTPIKENASHITVCDYIENDLNFLVGKKRAILKLTAHENGPILNRLVAQNTIDRISAEVKSYDPLGGAIIVLILIGAGIYYVYNNIFI